VKLELEGGLDHQVRVRVDAEDFLEERGEIHGDDARSGTDVDQSTRPVQANASTSA
jgi:hypothetical protein